MAHREDAAATVDFVSAERIPAPAVATGDIEVAPPPELPRPAHTPLLTRLLPVTMAVAMIGATVLLYRSGSLTARNPAALIFPAMMLVSACGSAVSGRGRHGGNVDTDRRGYLDYLSGLRRSVTDTAAAQRESLLWRHPEPAALSAVVGGARMWERRSDDPDFGEARVGVGTQRLATRLVAPPPGPGDRHDPVTATALRRFLDTHSSIPGVPVTITLRGPTTVTVDGEPAAVRGLLRAVICQLAVWHPPEQLLIVAVTGDGGHEWDWLKWLPHHQHPTATDDAGWARLRYRDLAGAADALAGLSGPHPVVVVDTGEQGAAPGAVGWTLLQVGADRDRPPAAGLRLRVDEGQILHRPDDLGVADALVCARLLAGYRAGGGADPLGIGDPEDFDPTATWRARKRRDALRVPIGTTSTGAAVDLDIKEAAEGGMGPHGLCIGATGSGKSELLRTVTLGMIARHSPDELNLVLVDFKGGATFLGLERAHHVAAVITNLADEAPLVARMRDALAGEMTRRQDLLRAAGNFVSAAAYREARRAGASLDALPVLFIIVDEFSELLGQHPDFVDMFVAIARLGRSLGMHLLLASQRLDEGRLRGLESHLSYRMCLKTLSASESRIVLGVPVAHELPSTPGAGYLRPATGELIRFQAAFVSGPCPHRVAAGPGEQSVRLFTAAPNGTVTSAASAGERSVLQTVLDRVAGRGPSAHPVWLPPLASAPPLDTLLSDAGPDAPVLTVPIGIVDRPFEQRRTPLMLDVSGAAGNVAIVGAPQSGKSTAVCTLITALAATHDPAQVQFYCLDFGGGALESVRALPHVGAVAGRAEPDLITRMIAELEAVIARRETRFRARGVASMARYRRLPRCDDDPFGDVFLVVDGWASLRHDFEALEAPITALAGRGLSFGVHVVLAAARWADIRPALKDQCGTRIELRLGDPAESEADRRRAQQVPAGAPGRGLTCDGLHMILAAPSPDQAVVRGGGRAAPLIRLLPARVERDTLLEAAGADLRARILVGIAEGELAPVALDFAAQPNLLVLGDNGCGKTSVLRTVCREVVRTATPAQAQLIIVDYRRALLGVVDSDRLGGYAISPATLDGVLPDLLTLLRHRMPGPAVTQQQLRARSWWSGPELYLVVDDYDLVAAAGGNPLSAIAEFLPYAGDLGLHLVVARRSGGAARAMFEPLLAALRDLGCMGLMLSGSPDDGPLIGSVRPVPLPPGRGTLLTRGAGAQRIQVAWSPPP